MKTNPDIGERERVRELILLHGWNSTCYQLLNPGFHYWFSTQFEAVVGFVEHAHTRIVGGAPVCSSDVLPEVVREFESDARHRGLRVCFFASEGRLERLIAGHPGYSSLLLGAQPVWKPSELIRHMERKPSLRTQLHRARNKGVAVERWSASSATDHPQLHSVLIEWLATRGLPSLHFLVEPETLSNLADRRVFVARRADDVIGFVNVSPVPGRNGWLIEQFVRGHNAPNGTVELMLYECSKQMANERFDYLTLGLSPLIPLSGYLPDVSSPFMRFLLRWAHAHGKRFYDFRGLEFFKSKFEPERWEPIYAISTEQRFSLHSLYAIACAFTNGHPIGTVLAGIGRAAKQELHWLSRRHRGATPRS